MLFFRNKSKKTEKQEEISAVSSDNKPETLKWEDHLISVMEKTGLSRDEVKAMMVSARKRYGISYKDYDKFNFHETPEEEQEERYEKILKRREAREQCLSMIMEHDSCTRKEAAATLDEARERLGVSYRIYRRYHFFALDKEEQAERLSEINATQEARKKETEDKEAKFSDIIMKETGWSQEKLTSEFNKAHEVSGANMTDFFAFRMWELTPDEQAAYFTRDLSKAIADRLDINAIYSDTLLNKELSCEYFADFMRRPWGINRKMSYEDFRDRFGEATRIVYKPLNGHGGIGIEFFDIADHDLKELYDKIHELPVGLVESFVVQHPEMSRLAPNSVNTVRIVTVSAKANGHDILNDFFDIAYAAVRVGRGEAQLDNFSKGGFVAGVNKETGIVETCGVSVDGEIFDTHPDTGVTLKGFQIPMFREVLDFVTEMGKKIDGYIGWDIAVSETGPMLIEANTNPGNRLLQMPYMPERKGMRYVMDKYLKEIIE